LYEHASSRQSRLPNVVTVYGGVYPTYHAAQILAQEPSVDFIVRGEGEVTAVGLLKALQTWNDKGLPWSTWAVYDVPGIAFRTVSGISLTPEAPPIHNLNAFRIGWELIAARRVRNIHSHPSFGSVPSQCGKAFKLWIGGASGVREIPLTVPKGNAGTS